MKCPICTEEIATHGKRWACRSFLCAAAGVFLDGRPRVTERLSRRADPLRDRMAAAERRGDAPPLTLDPEFEEKLIYGAGAGSNRLSRLLPGG